MFEDKALVRRLKQGDEGVLRGIYEKYKDDLLTVAACILGEDSEAEEVVREVFVSFAGGIGQFYLFGSLKSYLVTSVVSRVRERLARKMYRVVGLDSTGPLRADLEKRDFQRSEGESERLLEKLTQIPLQQRETVVLRLAGGMKFREIAAMQEISSGAARGRYRYGLEKLGTILRSEVIE